jgi:lysophospholipase L1-like esterase
MAQAQLSLKKKLLFTALLTFAVLLLAGGAGEIYVRQTSEFGYVTPEIIRQRSLQYEPSLFARNLFPPRAQTAYGGKTVGDGLVYPINSRGYRGPEFAVPKPPGLTRVIIYGGSQVFDVNAANDQDWPRRSEKILRGQGFNVEIINAGTPGHASWDSVGKLFAEGHAFAPDYVVLCESWNDLKTMRTEKPLLRQFKPYNTTQDPRLNYQNSLDRFLCERSQLFVRLRLKYYSWRLRAGSQGQIPEAAEAAGDRLSDAALAQYRLNVQTFADVAKNAGAVPVLMTQPRLASLNNTDDEKKRLHYYYVNLTHEGLVKAFGTTDDIIRRTAQEKGATLLDAAPKLSGRGDLFADEVHYNDAGSQAIAELTAAELRNLLTRRHRDTETQGDK